MGKYQNKLRKRLRAQNQRRQRDRGTFAHPKETEAFRMLRQMYDNVSRYCDSKDPYQQILHHLAGTMDLWGPHQPEGGESFQAVCENIPGAGDLYGDFVEELWIEIMARVRHEQPLIDPLGDLYEEVGGGRKEGYGQYFTPMALVRTVNAMTLHGAPRIHPNGLIRDAKFGIYHPGVQPVITPETKLAVSDPTCGTGRFGIDAMAYHPTVMMWNADLDIVVYRTALVNARLLLNITSGRFTLADGKPAYIIMGRANHLHCNSLVVNLLDKRNWNKGNNLWDPLDWRTELYSMGDKTFAEWEKEKGENHAYDMHEERTKKRQTEHPHGIHVEGPPIDVPQGTVIATPLHNDAELRAQTEAALDLPTMQEVLAFGTPAAIRRLNALDRTAVPLLERVLGEDEP
jgi:hypothetical protein